MAQFPRMPIVGRASEVSRSFDGVLDLVNSGQDLLQRVERRRGRLGELSGKRIENHRRDCGRLRRKGSEPWADTTTPAGCMVLTVFAGIAEFERSLSATRTEEGRRAAQARGVPFGRPPKLRPDQRTLARQLTEEGKSISDAPGPSTSMSQRSIVASTTRRPYDSTPFRSHARSVS